MTHSNGRAFLVFVYVESRTNRKKMKKRLLNAVLVESRRRSSPLEREPWETQSVDHSGCSQFGMPQIQQRGPQQ